MEGSVYCQYPIVGVETDLESFPMNAHLSF